MYATIPNKKIVHYSDSVFGYHKLKNGNLRNIMREANFGNDITKYIRKWVLILPQELQEIMPQLTHK